jgi:phage shock protein A
MRVFHRLQQTLSLHVEALLDQVENQEAVVLATIREVERGGTRVRIHRKACDRRIEELEKCIEKQRADAELWRDRARRLKLDREKALECLRRFRAAEAQGSEAKEQLKKQQQLLESLREDERVIEDKLAELGRRRAQLSSREARTDAQAGLADLGDIDDVFDRWEARIEEREVATEARASAKDGFARSLSEEEERAALADDLERLLAEEDTHGA